MSTHAPYDLSFYEETEAGSRTAARLILSRVRSFYKFTSFLDVGCGLASWVRVARELGADRATGVDGQHVPLDMLEVGVEDFISHDLESPLHDIGKFDLTVCVEVAEHLSPARGPTLVADLVRASDVVAFSAAIPFQGGDGHLNEAWPSYWGMLFDNENYLPWDGLRREIWNIPEIPWWYRQNLLLFVKRDAWKNVLGTNSPTPISELSVVHPECYIWAARRATAKYRTSLKEDISLYRDSRNGLFGIQPGYGPEFPAPAVYGRSPR